MGPKQRLIEQYRYVEVEDPFCLVDPAAYPLLSKTQEVGYSLEIDIKRSAYARYYHSHTMYADWSDYGTPEPEDIVAEICKNELTLAVAEIDNWTAKIQQELDALLKAVEEAARDKADTLYGELEELHDHLTSDEVVWEFIEADGLDEGVEDEETDSQPT